MTARAGVLLAVALNEARLSRRLVRYWVFNVLAMLIALAGWAYYAFLHYAFSSYSATIAAINPRYLVAALGLYYLFIALFGVVFLGYDVRARDQRERILDVLDARPYSNLELLGGKFLGLLIASWVPVLVVGVLLAILGAITGQSIEPLSLIGMVTALVLPAFCFALGLTFLVTLLVRHRGLAAIALLIALGGLYFAIFRLPLWLTPLVDVTGAYVVTFPSDILPGVAELTGWLQRFGVAIVGVAMVVIAAAVHPRLDDGSRAQRAGVGLAMLIAGVALCGLAVLERRQGLSRHAEARRIHEAVRDAPIADLLAMTGEVRIEPGSELHQKMSLRLRAPADRSLETLLLSLNPGLTIERLGVAGGAELPHTFDHGLIEARLPAPLGAGEELTIELAARGRPAGWYGYLDSVVEPYRVAPIDGQIFLLGFDALVFHSRYVALLPGSRWLPASGGEIGRGDPRTRPTDFVQLELDVDLPQGWLAAGPGRRQERSGAAGRAAFRFAPPAPVPDIALVAGRLESRRTEIEGVTLELLLHPSHVAGADYFADAADEIHGWLEERLRDAREIGLAYPYDGLTMVEIPGTLRGYGGGWRLDTTLAPPGMILVREASFPTARFDARFRKPETYRDREGGVPRAKREVLTSFFESDFNGGHPFIAAARSFFGHVTSGSGAEGLPLDFVCETLVTRLLIDGQGYFSAHVFNNKDINQAVGSTISTLFSSGSSGKVSDALIQTMTSRPAVWEAVLGVSLARLDPAEDPKRTIDVLSLKGGAMARSMLDELGRRRTATLLSTLRQNRLGQSFDREDLLAAGREVGEDLGPWLDSWIEGTDLPGFVADEVRVERIDDAPGGAPRYQLIVPVRNDEAAPGLFNVTYPRPTAAGGTTVSVTPGGADSVVSLERPVRLAGHSAVEVGIVTSEPPRQVRILPYLSLNRGPFEVRLPSLETDKIVSAEPFIGVREVAYDRGERGEIVVDDLDPGFRVVDDSKRGMLRLGSAATDEELDQGLPIVIGGFGATPSAWSRQSVPRAWGRYRHTLAFVRAGEGERRAVFAAELPSPGSWRLEVHVPRSGEGGGGSDRLKDMALVIVQGDDRQEIAFDAAGAAGGWNDVERFELGAGSVEVEVSDKSEGRVVVADAIRWVPDRPKAVATPVTP